jgi:HTH-type transcriptional regulator/antitoxin HipB
MTLHYNVSRKRDIIPLFGDFMTTTVRDLGATVRQARVARGLSQKALAEQARVSRQWLSRFESGKNPSAELLKVLDVFSSLNLVIDVVDGPANETAAQDPFAYLFGDAP